MPRWIFRLRLARRFGTDRVRRSRICGFGLSQRRPGGVEDVIRRLVAEANLAREPPGEKVTEVTRASPARANCLVVTQKAHRAVGERLERHGLPGSTYGRDHLAHDLLACRLDRRRARQRWLLADLVWRGLGLQAWPQERE